MSSYLRCLVVATIVLPGMMAHGGVSLCQNDASCVCVWWTHSTGYYEEVRCPSDASWWDPSQPWEYRWGDGTWGGPGVPPTNDPSLGCPIPEAFESEFLSAKGDAIIALKGDRDWDPIRNKPIWVPNACSDLFYGSGFEENGSFLLGNYIDFRYGEGVAHPDTGQIPCDDPGTAAWTFGPLDSRPHSRNVMLCGSFFASNYNDRINILIHEGLHVAGQGEAPPSGPGNPLGPPTPEDLYQTIKDACNL